jgi:hypothetical protein
LQVAGLPTSQVDPDLVLFFELETPMNDAVGGEELLRQPQGRSDRVIVGFADGSAHQITADELANLRWKP